MTTLDAPDQVDAPDSLPVHIGHTPWRRVQFFITDGWTDAE